MLIWILVGLFVAWALAVINMWGGFVSLRPRHRLIVASAFFGVGLLVLPVRLLRDGFWYGVARMHVWIVLAVMLLLIAILTCLEYISDGGMNTLRPFFMREKKAAK